MRSYAKSGALDRIHQAGGEVFAITSEPQRLATEAEEDWEFGFPAVGDPHHEIREICRERGLLDIFFNENSGHLRERQWASHPKGYYQPGVLALAKDGRVLYRWRCRPTRDNMSGAGGRPAALYTWDQIESRLSGGAEPALDETAELAGHQLSWPHFLLILLAHGWFIRPKAFPLGRPGDKPSANSAKMMRRVGWFVAAWVAAFILLPATWVLVGLAAWGVLMIPGLVEIYGQFQHEPERDPNAV
ncbi:MAG: hypothetical protein HKP27_11775 [Myxococcales bacterium]|nr:hypothetical protein [Myxococcales bacterium]